MWENVTERPSILEGEIDEIIKEANEYLKKGVYGFDLLGYRYTGNAVELNERFVLEVNAPVCIAGSVNGYERLDELKNINPWSFTIGSAFLKISLTEVLKSRLTRFVNMLNNKNFNGRTEC